MKKVEVTVKKRRNYKQLGVIVAGVLGLGWLVTMSAIPKVQAQYHEGKSFAAYGTVLEKSDYVTGPRAAVGKETDYSSYMYVKFKTEEGVTFVIPFRTPDIEAIPAPEPVFDREYPASPAVKEHTVHEDAILECNGGVLYQSSNRTADLCKSHDYVVPASPAKPYEHVHVQSKYPHGILRYHQCDGPFYCFDSWEDK